MERVMFVEVLNRRGDVKSRIRVDDMPVTVGRGYGCDIIVEDRLVCPEHLRLSLDGDGRAVAEDLGSVNGTYRIKDDKRIESMLIEPDTTLRIGQTLLRFRWSDHRVPPTVAQEAGGGRFSTFPGGPYASIALFLLAVSVMMANSYFEKTGEYGFSDVLENILSMVTMMFLWTGLWSFASRVVSHSFRFMRHLALVSSVLVLVVFSGTALEYISYVLLFGERLQGVMDDLLGATLFAVLLYGHISLVTPAHRRGRIMASAFVSLALFGTLGLKEYIEKSGFSPGIEFNSSIKPVSLKLLPRRPADGFFDSLTDMQKEIDEHVSDEE